MYPDRNTQAVNQQALPLVLPEEEREAEEEKIKIGRSENAARLRGIPPASGASPDNFISTQLQKQTKAYLSELIWIMITFLVWYPKSTERER